jgi:hypothetical protein
MNIQGTVVATPAAARHSDVNINVNMNSSFATMGHPLGMTSDPLLSNSKTPPITKTKKKKAETTPSTPATKLVSAADPSATQSSSASFGNLRPPPRDRSQRPLAAATEVPAATPQELRLLTVTEGETAMQYHLKRLSLREKAQELANIKCEDVDVTTETIQEAKQLARDGGLQLYLFDEIELGHMLMQFKQLDVNNDGKINARDIRSLILRVDPDWARSDDHSLQTLLDVSAREWLRSASADGSEDMTFVGFVKALMKKRADEGTNFGYSDEENIPSELLQHPFWDLRNVLCSSCSTELSGWMLKRGYIIPKSSMNAWKLRYFRLVLRDGLPHLEYWDDYQPSEMENDDSMSLSFPAITRCVSSLTDSRTRDAAVAQALREQTQAESAVAAALAAVDAGSRLNRSRANSNANSGLRYQGALDSSRINRDNAPNLKGSIDIREIMLFDFSPKTVVKLSQSATDAIQSNNINMLGLTVFKIMMRNGRTYSLACSEEAAINWGCELIRFSNRFHAEADWKRNWGTDRLKAVCLRDWLNASSVSYNTVSVSLK